MDLDVVWFLLTVNQTWQEKQKTERRNRDSCLQYNSIHMFFIDLKMFWLLHGGKDSVFVDNEDIYMMLNMYDVIEKKKMACICCKHHIYLEPDRFSS